MSDTLEFVILEELLNDSPECEADHTYGPVCSIEACYVGTDCTESLLLCKNAVDAPGGIREQMTKSRCSKCFRMADTCWEVRPV